MPGMQSGDLIVKLGGRGIPPLRARKFMADLLSKRAQVTESDPIYEAVKNRPVTDELVGDKAETELQDALSLVGMQQAQVAQAQQEAAYSAQQAQQIQQAAGQQVAALQQQVQQVGQQAQQAQAGMMQAQQAQGQMAVQMAQLQQEGLQAGQAAIEARQTAFEAQRQHQALMEQILSWSSQLRNMIDQNPVQQQMQAQQAQQQAQEQMAMAQQMGVPPEQLQQMQAQAQQGAPQPGQPGQDQGQPPQQGQEGMPPPEQMQAINQMSQAQEQKQASMRALRKLAAPIPRVKNPKAIISGVAGSALGARVSRALGRHPAVVLGVGAASIGAGAMGYHLVQRVRARQAMERRLRGSDGQRQAIDTGNLGGARALRQASSAYRQDTHGAATPGRSLRGRAADAAWATPKMAAGRISVPPGFNPVGQAQAARAALQRIQLRAPRMEIRGLPSLLPAAQQTFRMRHPVLTRALLGAGALGAGAGLGYGAYRSGMFGMGEPAREQTPYGELLRGARGQAPTRMLQLRGM